ncbi:MAG: uracil-DNA glycosylase [Pedosphaera sp.]|nr:uracil-DNA glycosylase [Pedosphaera sp.]
MMDDKPNCWRCRHFQITHHKSFPYGCLVMGFKSRQLPCLEVLSVDGVPCKRFEIKPHLKSR